MRGSRESGRVARVAALVGALLAVAGPARAEVTGITITERTPFAGGQVFGSAGAYEKIKGVLRYAVDPAADANRKIFDVDKAPRTNGRVEFEGEFILLKPVDLAKGNHRLLFEVNNRGNLRALGYFNNAPDSNDPTTAQDAGNGFLMRQGFTLLWAAWNWDAVPGSGRMQFGVPVAVNDDGTAITGDVNAETVTAHFDNDGLSTCEPVAWGNSYGYAPADPNGVATLTVRDDPWGPRTVIPRSDWQWKSRPAPVNTTQVRADLLPTTVNSFCVYDPVTRRGAIKSGRIYEIVYRAKEPRVVGLGLAAIRDAISFFRFGAMTTGNPLAEGGAPDPVYAYLFGISQSGRVITHFLWQGFHVDEAGTMVVDGMIPHVAGGGKGGFNWRFAQTTHHPSHLEGMYFPVDFFPFTYVAETEPFTGEVGSLLDEATRLGRVPRVMVTNHESEYFMRAASLIHTDPMGVGDVAFPDSVRYYMVNGAQHGTPPSRTRSLYQYPGTTVDQRPLGRAVLMAMDAWVSRGAEPPASRYPRIGRGELVTVAAHQAAFPSIPRAVFAPGQTGTIGGPGTCEQAPRLDYGPEFFTAGIQGAVPPVHLGDYVNLVPRPDSDGNTVGGVLLPDVAVPLGTYAGWNPRKPEIGNPGYLARWDGSFFMFPQTEAERAALGDPRPSIESRYKNKGQYVSKVTQAAKDLVKAGLILQEDADDMTTRAAHLTWPPVMTETYPFWEQQP